MSSAAELINVENNDSFLANSSMVNFWNTITDGIPCVRAAMVCLGATADDVPWSDGSIVCSGASAGTD